VLRLGRRAATFDRRSSSESEIVAAITGAKRDGDGNGNGRDQQ